MGVDPGEVAARGSGTAPLNGPGMVGLELVSATRDCVGVDPSEVAAGASGTAPSSMVGQLEEMKLPLRLVLAWLVLN